MAILPSRYYQFGDKITARWEPGQWTPGRVVSVVDDYYIRRAISGPYSLETESRLRVLPPGAPIFGSFTPEDLRLKAHDPDWNPFVVKPFMTPVEHGVLGGFPGFASPSAPGLTHAGAYMPGTWYETGDPVWAWADGWRRATVIEGKRSWIQVRYVDYRLPNGYLSKSYRPVMVWPVLCDHPKPVQKIVVDAKWATIAKVE